MHWLVQQSLFKPENYTRLTNALVRQGIEYTVVGIANGTLELLPDVNPQGKVYVCGALKLRKIAEQRSWFPGSFLNDNFRFDLWLQQLNDELLNHDAVIGRLKDIEINHKQSFFIRPLEDNKAFDGVVMDMETFVPWCRSVANQSIASMPVVVSSVKDIYREYRLFVVQGKVVTGSVYKMAGKAVAVELNEPEVVDYANRIDKKWAPAESYVIDIAATAKGFKVIEFNNINSSGFYASDVDSYVRAIQAAYAV